MLKGLRQYQRNFGDTIAKPEGTKSRSGIERGYDYKYCRHEAYRHDKRHVQGHPQRWQVLLCIIPPESSCRSRLSQSGIDILANSTKAVATVSQNRPSLNHPAPQHPPRPTYIVSQPVAFLIRPTLLDMFGSSQDRARQLAGRYRNNRKTSGSSYTSSRSVSSSTQLPFQLQTHANLEKKYRYRVVLAKQHHHRLY